MSLRPSVSVVVVTRGRPLLLAELLVSLGRQTCAPREIVVVDNGPDAATESAAARAGARYVEAKGLGRGAARQAGVDAAAGDIVAFTDDDCLPEREWLLRLVEGLADAPALVGVQGATLPALGPIGAHTVRVTRPDSLYQTCNMAYRSQALRRAGGFDARFQGWFEDTAMAARVLHLGRIGWEPRARVVHRAMPRRRLDRAGWSALLADERVLASEYPQFYRRHRGPGFALTVVSRWLLGSPLKTLLANLPRARRDPWAYVRLMVELLHERRDLALVLWHELRSRGGVRPTMG